jgi:hypothetical protein
VHVTGRWAERQPPRRGRTTLDLPRPVRRTLKPLAADEDTGLQALVAAAILQIHPDLA